MTLYARKDVLLAKLDVTYGTDPVPTGAANSMLVSGLTITPMEQRLVSRDLIRQYFGNSEQLPAEIYAMAEFDVELQSSGAAGTAPKFGPLLQACSLKETVTPATRVVYDPTSTDTEQKSVTLYAYKDGVLHKMVGARGNVRASLINQDIPKLRFRMLGLYSTPTDASPTGVSYTGWVKPKIVNATNTATFTLHAVSPIAASIELDLKNTVVYRDYIGGTKQVLVTDRKPDGAISFEAVTVATKNWFSTVEAATTGALAIVHGTGAGNVVKIDAPAVQVVQPAYDESDGIAMMRANLILVPSVGNDEIKFTFE